MYFGARTITICIPAIFLSRGDDSAPLYILCRRDVLGSGIRYTWA